MTVPWGLLVRISDDRAGEGAGVARQEQDGRREVDRRGGAVAELYRENDTSAFKKRVITLPDGRRARRVVRPEFRRGLDDLYRGRIGGLMVYDLDRFVREPRDLEDAIEVAEETGRPIASVTGSLDLSSNHGIMTARVMVSAANQASRDTSRRVRRMHLALAEAGRPGGGSRPYGYTQDRLHVVPEEAAIVRELAARRLAGEGWQSLAKDLNRRQVRPVRADLWSIANVRSVLLKPHVAGVRTLRGVEIADGTWPAILDRATWEQVRATTHERRPPPVRRYLLSGIARCGLCGHGLGAASDRGRQIYRCKHISCGRVSRDRAALDQFISGVALEVLSDLDRRQRPAAGASTVAAELAALQQRRAATVAAFADVAGQDPVELRQALAGIDENLQRLRRRLPDEDRPTPLTGLAGVSEAEWSSLPLDRRRVVLGLLLRITVHPSRRGHGPLDTASVRVEQQR